MHSIQILGAREGYIVRKSKQSLLQACEQPSNHHLGQATTALFWLQSQCQLPCKTTEPNTTFWISCLLVRNTMGVSRMCTTCLGFQWWQSHVQPCLPGSKGLSFIIVHTWAQVFCFRTAFIDGDGTIDTAWVQVLVFLFPLLSQYVGSGDQVTWHIGRRYLRTWTLSVSDSHMRVLIKPEGWRTLGRLWQDLVHFRFVVHATCRPLRWGVVVYVFVKRHSHAWRSLSESFVVGLPCVGCEVTNFWEALTGHGGAEARALKMACPSRMPNISISADRYGPSNIMQYRVLCWILLFFEQRNPTSLRFEWSVWFVFWSWLVCWRWALELSPQRAS